MNIINELIEINIPISDWSSGSQFYGNNSFKAKELIHIKIFNDRRAEGFGLTYLLKFSPPENKLIRITATTKSEEQIFILKGGFCDIRGKQIASLGDFSVNVSGKNHGGLVNQETISLVYYRGEPDFVKSFEVIDESGLKRFYNDFK